jgi:hypothetical protein
MVGRAAERLSFAWELATVVVLFFLALFVFHGLLGGVPDFLPGDHHFHLKVALGRIVDPVPHPLYHYAVLETRELTGQKSFDGAWRSAAIVLALAFGIRGWLTFRELRRDMIPGEAALACLLLGLALALPNWWKFPSILVGQINPNVWHNPTALMAAPFAMLIFVSAMRYWDNPRLFTAVAIGIWSALCALAKPNYLLAFLPCFGPVLFVLVCLEVGRHRLSLSGAFAHLLAAFAPPVWVLTVQFFYAFGGETRVVFDPLGAWSSLSPNIPASILLGLAFPCVVIICFPLKILRDRRLLFSWCVLGVAIAQFALLAETPDARYFSGNFGWGQVPASYLVFVESCRVIGRQTRTRRGMLCALVLALHAGSGLLYLARSLRTPGDCQRF